jgi:hypothetical protein
MLLIIDKAHAEEGLTAQVYNVLGQNGSPYIPQGASPIVTTAVPNIDFQWGGGSVLGGPSEDVIVRFTGSILSNATQNISFLATADDGTRLYIDGILVADDWVDKGGGGTTTDPISFTAGVSKTIELMYYENGGGANVFLHWDQSGSMDIIPASAFTSQAAPVVKTIGPPRNLTIISGETSTVLSWEAPDTGNTQPERYAISFNCSGCNGWGIATGNVGGPNSLNTTITIDHSLLDGLMPAGTIWSFHIRSDNDTFSLYSANSNVVTGSTYVAPAPQPSPEPTPSPSQTATVTIPTPETITVTTPTPETQTVTTPNETSTVTTPTPSETATVTIPTGPTEAEIAATTAALAAAQAAEAARIQAETAALVAAQAAAAQAEAERIAAEEAAREAARIQAEAEAKAEADRIEAEIEAERIQAEIEAQEEADRIAAELKAAEEKAEAEAKAEAERIEAERIAEEERLAEEAKAEAERIAAEEEAIAKAKAEAEAEALAEEKRIAEEAEAKELEEEKAAEEEAKAEEEELNEILEDAKDGKELTEEQKDVVVAALIEDLKPGESISAAEVQASGVSYADLPPETPVELRTDENGNALIITAEVAANIELVQDPGALLEAAFTDPGAALAALGSVGADMTEAEREEATEMVVATVVAAGAAINAAAVAAGGATGGSTGGGSSGGGGASGANSPGSRGGRKW